MTARPLDQEWFTARELAALQLRDLPTTRQGVQAYAEARGWDADPARCRDRAGRGGGLEYHLSLIPTLSWADYHRRTMVVGEVAPIRPQPVLPTPETERARVTQAARLAILTALERYGAGLNVREEGRVFAFVGAYNMGHLKVDDWVREAVPSVSKRSLFRWRAEAKAGKSLGFDRSLARKGKGVLDLANDGKVAAWIMGLVAANPALSAKHIRRDLRAVFGDDLMLPSGELTLVPPIRTLQHWIKAMKAEKHVALTALSNPDKFRSHFRPSGTGAYNHVRDLNTLWMIDASPVDALCVDGRHSIYACIDIASRRTIWYVSRTPRASAVGLLIRKAILAWGICRQIKTDNGSDFKAIQTQQLFHDLNIDVDYCVAYTPQQKGHVERAIKTFQHDCGPLLPGYIGHDVTERKAIEDRKSFAERLGEETAEAFAVSMTGAQLATYLDDWNSLIYEQQDHSALGKSPAQAAAASTTVIRRVDERALDVLLMPIAGKDGIRTVTKTGIRIDHFDYVIMEALPRDRVLVRMDPHDAGRAYAFDAEDGHFVGAAICAELRGIAPATLIKAKRERQAEILRDHTAAAKKAIKESQKRGPLIERALEVARRDMPNVVALPKREERHTTPAIEAAIEAASPRPPAARPNEAEVRATMDRLTAQVHAEVFPVPPSSERIRPLRPTETREQRFRKWLQLEARRIAGDELSFAEANWMGSYQTDSEWKAMKRLYDAGATF
jgi:hypothetical protein